MTVSTDNLLETNEFRAAVGAGWTFLSDPGRKLQKDLDIAEYTDPHHNPMIPHTLVLEPGLRVYKIYNGYWFFGRPTVEELRLDLRAVLQRCRPDWDISSAEQQPGRKAKGPSIVRKNASAGARRTGLISSEGLRPSDSPARAASLPPASASQATADAPKRLRREGGPVAWLARKCSLALLPAHSL